MLDDIVAAVAKLSGRIGNVEARPHSPYLADAQMFDHFAGDGTLDPRWTPTTSGTGAITLPNTTPTIARLATGATVSSIAQLDWGGARYALIGANAWVEARARFAVTTAVDADDVMVLRLATSAADVWDMGVRGATSTAFFFARTTSGGAVNITTTTTPVAIDTAYHDWRIQGFPDRVRFYIDDDLVAEHTTNFTTAAFEPRLNCSNGANGGSRVMDVDMFYVREARL